MSAIRVVEQSRTKGCARMCAKEFRNVPVHRLLGAAPSIPCNQMSDTHKQTQYWFACTSSMISLRTAACPLHWDEGQSKRRENNLNRCYSATTSLKLAFELKMADANTKQGESVTSRQRVVIGMSCPVCAKNRCPGQTS